MRRFTLLISLLTLLGFIAVFAGCGKPEKAPESKKPQSNTSQQLKKNKEIEKQIADIKAFLPTVQSAVQSYVSEHTTFPTSVDELERSDYIVLDSHTKGYWSINLIYELETLSKVKAVSKPLMKGGAGYVVIFDVISGSFEEIPQQVVSNPKDK